ncbi:hypothetical protein AAHA92_29148 [Salvia divinorum]|uniref:Uncharacterized protein n=1 Tax=Salvia divinorum TaxID=28513 RepID=A0ABD1FXE0_SALDI
MGTEGRADPLPFFGVWRTLWAEEGGKEGHTSISILSSPSSFSLISSLIAGLNSSSRSLRVATPSPLSSGISAVARRRALVAVRFSSPLQLLRQPGVTMVLGSATAESSLSFAISTGFPSQPWSSLKPCSASNPATSTSFLTDLPSRKNLGVLRSTAAALLPQVSVSCEGSPPFRFPLLPLLYAWSCCRTARRDDIAHCRIPLLGLLIREVHWCLGAVPKSRRQGGRILASNIVDLFTKLASGQV